MFLKKKCNKDQSWPPPKCKKCYTFFFLKASLRNPLKNPSDPNVFPHSCGQLNSLRSFCSFVLVLFVLNNVRHPSSSKFSSFLLNSGMFRYFQKCKKTTSEAEWSVPACDWPFIVRPNRTTETTWYQWDTEKYSFPRVSCSFFLDGNWSIGH